MSQPRSPKHNALPRETLQNLDVICSSFERAWAEPVPPRLEDYLVRLPEHKELLFADLLAVEVDQRRRRGERAIAEEYLGRFPELTETIVHLLAEQYRPGSIDETRDPDQTPTAVTRPIRQLIGRTLPYPNS